MRKAKRKTKIISILTIATLIFNSSSLFAANRLEITEQKITTIKPHDQTLFKSQSSQKDGDSAKPQFGAPPAPDVKSFVGFLWGQGSPMEFTPEERSPWFPLMMAHYSTSETSPTNMTSHLNYENYRLQAALENPNIVLSLYTTPLKVNNPVNESEYDYPDSDYGNGDFLCDNAPDPETGRSGFIFYRNYTERVRPDSHTFNRFSNPSETNFQPRLRSDRNETCEPSDSPDSCWDPWGPGGFGWLPFYYFQERGWVAPNSTMYCTPVVNLFSDENHTINQPMIDFAKNNLLEMVQAFPGANSIGFDNAVLINRDPNGPNGGWWVMRDNPGSPY